MKVLAIDQGTTSTKAFSYNETGDFQQIFSAEVKQIYPQAGWVEHDAQELLGQIRAAIQAAGDVDAIGLANQGETIVAWDAESGVPVYNAIVWQDSRTSGFCDALKARGVEDFVKGKTGLPLDPYFSASKFRWILDHVPKAQVLAAKGKLRLGTSDAFFLSQISGHFVTDVTTASRTSLMSLDTQQWDAELCALFGAPRQCLPEIRATTGDFGAKINASMVDQQAALFGHGCKRPGDAKITFGTGAFALAIAGMSQTQPSAAGLLPTVAWKLGHEPTQFAVDGGVYNAGSAVNWARSLGLFTDYEEINSFEAPTALSRGLVFVPALSGLACPHWDRNAAGLWIGLGLDTTKADMMQAVLEGIAMRAAEVIEVMRVGWRISIDGGLSQNRYFVQFLANALNRKVSVAASPNLTALGVARMAMLGAGFEALPPLAEPVQVFEPLQPLTAELRNRFAKAIQHSKNWR